MEFKINPQIHEQLWKDTEFIQGVTHKDLSFALSTGAKDTLMKYQGFYESSGNFLASVGLRALLSCMNFRSGKANAATPNIVHGTVIGASQKRQPPIKQSSSKMTQSTVVTTQTGPRSGVKQKQTAKGLLYPALASLPRKVNRAAKLVSERLISRGENKALHDDCAICNLFKRRAPRNGLFKSRQFKALCVAHNTSVSSALRAKKLLSAFSEQLEDSPAATSSMECESQKSNETSEPSGSVCKRSYAAAIQQKAATKAARKEEKAQLVDTLDVQVQVLDEKIKAHRSKLAESVSYLRASNTLRMPEEAGVELLALQAKRRELVKRKKQSLNELLGSKKVKR